MCQCVISCRTPNICNVSSAESSTVATVENTTYTSSDDSSDVITSNDTLCQCRYYAQQGGCSGTKRESCQTTCDVRDAVICPEPEPYNLTTVVPRLMTYRYIDKYKYQCIEGYKSVENFPWIVCIENGKWVVPGNQPLPTCQLKYCGLPPDVPHSSWNASHYYYNGTANYTCQPGYEMTSSGFTKLCGGAETWTGSVICEAVDCGPPPSMEHSTFLASGTRYPAMTNYSCDIGYIWTSGENVKSCSQNQTWTGVDIQCTVVSCGPPPDVNNSSTSVVSLDYLSAANYTCLKGYNITGGSDVKTCTEDAFWDGEDLICEIVSCGPVPHLDNSTVTADGETYGSISTYTCVTGHKPQTGNDVKICNEFGSWSGNDLVCILVTCGNPPTISHAYTSDNVTTVYLSLVNYTCNLGYEQVGGSDVKICNGDGAWEGDSIVCQEKPSVAESIGIITKFEPEVLEAEGSVGLGVASCVIMVIILGAIILLDLTTICHHFRFMRANIRAYLEHQKRRFQCRDKDSDSKPGSSVNI
ncbi:sushi, von Willebrand factor type A, EGF and pentraxin domain-containing protein 1-like [Gigantopelta aegis]|uniref:sushi, von Willebrand factor type A, EGF and pentraxin domain-containing protein 1-like n=1 Tax=Gigantopelta aegis TaxID=1735272 RepID=UPI001B888A8F|nr:sushi, von Willebrand factor type A, EGF and pentraxin domain-containing protein 1-like [Gigantopelta aegis]